MNKSKLFAFGISIMLVAVTAYAESRPMPPTLVVTKPTQPASSIAPAGALRVPFTAFDLTARGTDIVVESITVMRTGPGSDRVFDEILLLDEQGEELGGGSLNANHEVHFDEPFVIPLDTTLHLLVAANMAEELEEFDGQAPTLSVTHIVTSGVVMVR